jgi:DNA-binding helix-hairpin-helix protein with protein kinase domain
VYQYIKQLGIEHFTTSQKIPDSYFKALVVYIYQVSRAMAHVHKHGLVHGNLNLSKVLVQRVNKLKVRESDFNQDFSSENFFVTNFEPYQVQKVAQSFSAQQEY